MSDQKPVKRDEALTWGGCSSIEVQLALAEFSAQRDRHPSLDGAVNHSPSGIPTLGCVIAWAAAFAVVAVLFGSLLLIYIEPIAEHSRPVSVEIEQRVG